MWSTTGAALSRILHATGNDLTYMENSTPADEPNEYVMVTITSFALQCILIAAYIPPDAAFNMDREKDIVRSTPAPHVLTGDFNVHHNSWGSHKTTVRGRHLCEAGWYNGMTVINTGEPTFRGGAVSSTLNVTMVFLGLSNRAISYVDTQSQ